MDAVQDDELNQRNVSIVLGVVFSRSEVLLRAEAKGKFLLLEVGLMVSLVGS